MINERIYSAIEVIDALILIIKIEKNDDGNFAEALKEKITINFNYNFQKKTFFGKQKKYCELVEIKNLLINFVKNKKYCKTNEKIEKYLKKISKFSVKGNELMY